jgi:hypothetical protein
MASEVGIVNSAGIKIGVKNLITSLSDGTPLANLGANRYEEIRDELLRSHPWNFAVKRAKLARLSETPTYEYTYAYSMPDLWLRTILVADNDHGDGYIDYKEEDNKILTSAEDVYMKFVSKVTDPNIMTPDFRELIAMQLAVEGAINITNSRSMSDYWKDEFKSAKIKAKSTDSLGDRPDIRPQGSWATQRFRSSGFNHWGGGRR